MPLIQAKNESSITYTQAEFKGLLLALDPRTVEKPFVVDGRNFLLDVKGPYSAFTNRMLTYSQLFQPNNGFTFRVGTDAFIFVPGAVLKFDTLTQNYYPIYTFTDSGDQWPWSMATCGQNYFFCRKGVGVIMYSLNGSNGVTPAAAGSWTKLVTNIPNDPRSVTQALGRLIIVGSDQTGWSSLDDGTDFTPSQVTGAGFQGHTIINGVAKGLVCKQINDGVAIYTDKGCYIGQLSLWSNSPFRWIPGDRGRIPINPFCFADIDDITHVILDKKGLYQTNNGIAYEEFDPIMSEYLRTEIFKDHNLWVDTGNITNNIRLSYAKDLKYFFIHIARDAITPLYDYAFVRYNPRAEWGRFDYQHYFVGELSFTSGPSLGFNFGFWGNAGYFRKFISDAFAEAYPTDAQIWYTPGIEIPSRLQNIQAGQQSWVVGSYARITDYSEGVFQYNQNIQPGMFTPVITEYITPPLTVAPTPEVAVLFAVTLDDWSIDPNETDDWGSDIQFPNGTADEDWGLGGTVGMLCGSQINATTGALVETALPYIASSQALNSYIITGMYRFEEAQYDDEIGCVTNISIGCDDIPGDPTVDDYAIDNNAGADINEDWALLTGNEDYGTNLTTATSFGLSMIGTTDDGETIFMQETPTLYQNDGAAQFFTCQTNGVFHELELTAMQPGQSFHLKLLSLSGFMAGRL